MAEFKTARGITTSSDDTLIGSIIGSVVADLDGWYGRLGRAIINQTWLQTFDSFSDRLRLPMPATSVSSLVFVDPAGENQTLSSSVYVLRSDSEGSFLELAFGQDWPSAREVSEAVKITFVSGFGADSSSIPADIKHAIILLSGGLYSATKRDPGVKKIVVDGVGSREWDIASVGKDYSISSAESLLAKYRAALP